MLVFSISPAPMDTQSMPSPSSPKGVSVVSMFRMAKIIIIHFLSKLLLSTLCNTNEIDDLNYKQRYRLPHLKSSSSVCIILVLHVSFLDNNGYDHMYVQLISLPMVLQYTVIL